MSLIERFQSEVIERGAEACLPCNLTDEWLQVVSTSLEVLVDAEDREESAPAQEPVSGGVGMAAVAAILRHKRGGPMSLEISRKKLLRFIEEYRVELALEEVHRKTDAKYEPATLSTIFTHRKVRTWKESLGA